MGRRDKHGHHVRNTEHFLNSLVSPKVSKGANRATLCHRFWGKDQPNSYDGRKQDCVEFWYNSNSQGSWNDENCNVNQNWICEM